MEWALMSDTSLQVHLISVWPSMSIENLFILKSDTSLLRLNTHYMCLPTMFTGHEHKWWTRVTLLTPMFTIRVISMTHDIILTVTADDKCRLKTASVTITDSDWWVYQKRKGCCYWLLQWIMSRRPLPVLRKISGIFWMVSRTPTQAVYMGVQYTLSVSSACVGKKHCTTMFFWHSPCACAWRHSQAHAQYTPPVNTGRVHRWKKTPVFPAHVHDPWTWATDTGSVYRPLSSVPLLPQRFLPFDHLSLAFVVSSGAT